MHWLALLALAGCAGVAATNPPVDALGVRVWLGCAVNCPLRVLVSDEGTMIGTPDDLARPMPLPQRIVKPAPARGPNG